MADVKKVAPIPVVVPPHTYVVRLSEVEAQGLRRLLRDGVSQDALNALGLTHLHRQMSLTVDAGTHVGFATISQVVKR